MNTSSFEIHHSSFDIKGKIIHFLLIHLLHQINGDANSINVMNKIGIFYFIINGKINFIRK